MKKIMCAALNETTTEGEFQWAEATEAEYGREWDGNVECYVENLDIEDGYEASENYSGSIHNLPEGAIIIEDEDGRPVEIYWAEDCEEDDFE